MPFPAAWTAGWRRFPINHPTAAGTPQLCDVSVQLREEFGPDSVLIPAPVKTTV